MSNLAAISANSSVEGIGVEQHSLGQTLLFHLVPGGIVAFSFMVTAGVVVSPTVPASLVLLIIWLCVGIPLELGILLYQGWKRNGRVSLEGIVLYRQPLPARQYWWLVPPLLVWAAIGSTILFPLGEAMRQILFSWWPSTLLLSSFAQQTTQYPQSVLWTMVLLSGFLNVVVPVVEELYFRGYLLPRIAYMRQWAPLMNVVLFSLYHFWLPWDIFSRISALLPMVYWVQWKRNLYIGIFVHVLLNSLGTIGLLAVVLIQSA